MRPTLCMPPLRSCKLIHERKGPYMKLAALFVTLSVTSMAQNYQARTAPQQGIPVVHLVDTVKGVDVSVAPSLGNRVTEMKVHGKNILYFPVTDLAELKSKPALNGIPFLAPWGNRLDSESFWANDKNYLFNMTLGNVRGPIPIH